MVLSHPTLAVCALCRPRCRLGLRCRLGRTRRLVRWLGLGLSQGWSARAVVSSFLRRLPAYAASLSPRPTLKRLSSAASLSISRMARIVAASCSRAHRAMPMMNSICCAAAPACQRRVPRLKHALAHQLQPAGALGSSRDLRFDWPCEGMRLIVWCETRAGGAWVEESRASGAHTPTTRRLVE